jgi:hypothetical protein
MGPAYQKATGFQAAKSFAQWPTGQVKAGAELNFTDLLAGGQFARYDGRL